MKNTIKTLTYKDLNWDFDTGPEYNLKTDNAKYFRSIKVDPYPCYPHDENIIKELNKRMEDQYPIDYHIFCFILSHEGLGRTNGFADKNCIYNDWTPNPFDGIIVMHGKRIPLHPAMTRYLFTHEAGHCYDYYICNKLKLQDSGLDKEYAAFREIEYCETYGEPNWAKNTGEVIANDIRVALFDEEYEFWPHPFSHPEDFGITKIKDYWVSKLNEANNIKAVKEKNEP